MTTSLTTLTVTTNCVVPCTICSGPNYQTSDSGEVATSATKASAPIDTAAPIYPVASGPGDEGTGGAATTGVYGTGSPSMTIDVPATSTGAASEVDVKIEAMIVAIGLGFIAAL
jgi:hypothetical protein